MVYFICFVLFVLFFLILGDISPFVGSLIPVFWTSGDDILHLSLKRTKNYFYLSNLTCVNNSLPGNPAQNNPPIWQTLVESAIAKTQSVPGSSFLKQQLEVSSENMFYFNSSHTTLGYNYYWTQLIWTESVYISSRDSENSHECTNVFKVICILNIATKNTRNRNNVCGWQYSQQRNNSTTLRICNDQLFLILLINSFYNQICRTFSHCNNKLSYYGRFISFTANQTVKNFIPLHTRYFKPTTHFLPWLSDALFNNLILNQGFYRPQRSYEGYVFTGVCLSTGGYYSMPCSRSPGGWYPSMPCSRSLRGGIPACLAGGIPACLAAGLQGGCLLPGGCLPAPGRVPAPGGPAPGRCLLLGGVEETPPSQQTATVADGTHPTGMHSCWWNVIQLMI